MLTQAQFSDYIIYVDESGDHGLLSIDPDHPIFVLAFCVFHKKTYYADIVPRFKEFKFEFFGHDAVILHSHEIRKSKNEFVMLKHIPIRDVFINHLTRVINESDFTIIYAVVDKTGFKKRYGFTYNIYEIALNWCLEKAYFFLKSKEQHQLRTHVLIEKRGGQEDISLKKAFHHYLENNALAAKMFFEPIFLDKKHNSIGLQIADLVAHPIGKFILNPGQENRAYHVLEKNFTEKRKRRGEYYLRKTIRLRRAYRRPGSPNPIFNIPH